MLHSMSITSKLILTIGFIVIMGFSSLVFQQWITLNDGLHTLANKDRQAMTELLSQNVSGGIRWKKQAIIKKAYEKFVGSADTDVSNIITADLKGQIITQFVHPTLPKGSLDRIDTDWQRQLVNKQVITVSRGNHTIVAANVLSGKDSTPVGYLAIAFSNSGLQGFITSRSGVAVLVSAVAVSAILCVLLLIIRLLFTRPMQSLNDIAHELANGDGDLTRRLDMQSNDELGELASTINTFVGKLQSVMGNVVCSADKVHGSLTTARESATQNQQLLDQHAAELGQANDALQAMSSHLEKTAESAQGLAKSTTDASNLAESANQLADDAVLAVQGLTAKVHETESVIRDLDERSQNIGSVLDVIKSIAEQTNLLALNAAIEAARAGEQGRGFAVVADEVRTLASRTQQSTEEIQRIIESLQVGAQKAVTTMEQGQQDVLVSADKINHVKGSLTEIVACMDQISQTDTAVASDVNQQSDVAKRLSDNIDKISELSLSILENGQSTSQACERLSVMNSDLNTHVAFFKV